ncbi:phage late control D family protein [Paenibacillus xanthanilyticus]|uniref:Phage late control D family protein n=1 Tax=Paenibacillus xanthanilyticus TaxID=1783531 RepID=A0ABV8KA82_9BACL
MQSQSARQAVLTATYNGKDITAELQRYLLGFTYTDNYAGQLDDLQIDLDDRERLWQSTWSPAAGDTIDARIKTINWRGPNEFAFLPCGKFDVDSGTLSGPPDRYQLRALSLPAGSSASRERRTRAWEKVKLKTLAADIAKSARLVLLYEATDNPLYDRVEQTDQTDLMFLLEQCAREGIAIKVTNGKLVLFDEAEYEGRSPIATLQRNEATSYSFEWSTVDAAYRACELTYTDSKNKTLKVTYTPPDAPQKGPVLRVRDSASSEAEALRVARKRLREQNKNYGRASLALPGDTRMAAGSTITTSGWGRFDGKYIIERAKHTIGGAGAYTTDIEIRKVLGW